MYDCDEDLTREAGEATEALMLAKLCEYAEACAEKARRESRADLALFLFVLAAAAAGVALFVFASLAHAAPAPLQRRPPKVAPPPLPATCVARWYGCPYRTDFRPGGDYRAAATHDGGLVWTGRWRLDLGQGGEAVLVINETLDPTDDSAWHEYRITLAPGLREGTFESGATFSIAQE